MKLPKKRRPGTWLEGEVHAILADNPRALPEVDTMVLLAIGPERDSEMLRLRADMITDTDLEMMRDASQVGWRLLAEIVAVRREADQGDLELAAGPDDLPLVMVGPDGQPMA